MAACAERPGGRPGWGAPPRPHWACPWAPGAPKQDRSLPEQRRAWAPGWGKCGTEPGGQGAASQPSGEGAPGVLERQRRLRAWTRQHLLGCAPGAARNQPLVGRLGRWPLAGGRGRASGDPGRTQTQKALSPVGVCRDSGGPAHPPPASVPGVASPPAARREGTVRRPERGGGATPMTAAAALLPTSPPSLVPRPASSLSSSAPPILSLPSSCPAPTLREALPATSAMQRRGTVRKESYPGVPCPGTPGVPLPLKAHLFPSLSQLTCAKDSPSSCSSSSARATRSSSASGQGNSARKRGCSTASAWPRRKRL